MRARASRGIPAAAPTATNGRPSPWIFRPYRNRPIVVGKADGSHPAVTEQRANVPSGPLSPERR